MLPVFLSSSSYNVLYAAKITKAMTMAVVLKRVKVSSDCGC